MSGDKMSLLQPPPRPGLSRTTTTLTARDLLLQAKKNTVLKSHGRPPWYGEDGHRISDAFVIGIAGGSASGKTHVARRIVQSLGSIPTVIILSQDSFYKHHTEEEVALANENRFDFDHPDAIDMLLFASVCAANRILVAGYECLSDLKACRQTNIPMYSFMEHQRLDETKYLYGATIIIAEGIMALHDSALRALYDLKIFVQCDSDLMLARRIKRDVTERGRNVDGILEQYLRYVKPSYDHFVQPTSRYAHIIVPGSDNAVAIDIISTHIRRQLQERATQLRQRLAGAGPRDLVVRGDTPAYLNITLLPQTPQVRGILTILRDADTHRSDFIFFTDRLATLLVEKATELLPYRPKTVVTPVGIESHGKQVDVKHLCGVSILRSGGPLEHGLRRVINNIPIGSMLIQSEATTGEPLLLHLQLPVCIRHRHLAQDTYVFLVDAQIGTGATAFMAIRILLDHGVLQDHIIFVTLLVARCGGIHVLQRAFPDLKIVCAAVDDHLRETWLEGEDAGEDQVPAEGRKVWVVEPGMGHIGDRYYL